MIINWSKPNIKVSKHFTVGEVTQDDKRRTPINGSVIEKNILFLARKLDDIRDKWGQPIGVTSWYRPPDVNREVGGVINSQHLTGMAVDVYAYTGDENEFEEFLDREWSTRHLGYGVASGRGFTHLDLRIGRVRWTY